VLSFRQTANIHRPNLKLLLVEFLSIPVWISLLQVANQNVSPTLIRWVRMQLVTIVFV